MDFETIQFDLERVLKELGLSIAWSTLKDIEDIKTELKQDNKIFNMTDEEKRYQYLRRTSDSVAAISEAFKKVKAREYKDRMARHSEEVKLYEKIKKAKWLKQEHDTALRKAKLNLREKEIK